MWRREGMPTLQALVPLGLPGRFPCAAATTDTSAHNSASPSTGSSNYDRPNRLKGRDDGSIRWVELLEKFRSVQERARRVQRHTLEGEEMPAPGFGDLRIGEVSLEAKGKESRGPGPGAAPPVPQKDVTPVVPAQTAKKSGLGRQFGRLGGAVSGKNRRN